MQDELGSFGVKKALPFTKFLNYKLNKLRGSGVLQNTLTITKQNCPLNENPVPITFSKMVFLFTVLVLGLTFSIIIFIIERAVPNKKVGTLERIDDSAVVQRGPDFAEGEKRVEIEKCNLSLVTPPEFQSFLRHWMESDATRSKEEFLELMKLEVSAILVGVGQSDAIEKDHTTAQMAL